MPEGAIVRTGQSTVNKKSADSLYNLYRRYGPQTTLKMFQKIPPKFHDKAVQSNRLWLNLNKIGGISILLSTHKQGKPSFHLHAPGSKGRYPCTQTASAVPKYFLCLLRFCTDFRIWHASRVWKRKTSENPDTTNIFAIFRPILINWPPTYLL